MDFLLKKHFLQSKVSRTFRLEFCKDSKEEIGGLITFLDFVYSHTKLFFEDFNAAMGNL
jgi:hypothetical protein